MQSYTTKQGDMWDLIAYDKMGSCRHTGLLMENNTQYKDVFIFDAGCVLTIPETGPKENRVNPPWRSAKG